MRAVERRRGMNSGGGGLPYDAEVEWLEYDGYQYIDTGITPNQSIETEIKIIPTNNYANSCGLLSSRNTTAVNTADKSVHALNIWVNGTRLALNDKSYDSGWQNVMTYNAVQVISIRARKLYNNNTLIVSSSSTLDFNYDVTYGLLRCHLKNDTWDSRRGSSGKLFYVKIWKDSDLVRNFIPVRIGQVGYMYDKVSGQLFGNTGTGDFILGPDINS